MDFFQISLKPDIEKSLNPSGILVMTEILHQCQ